MGLSLHPINPTVAWLTVNRKCNFRCRWCYAEGTAYKTESDMSLEMATTLAQIAKDVGVQTILVIGGEPTLWSPLGEFNKFCASSGIRTILVTNGVRFGDDAFVERYREDPCDDMGLSIKAVTPEQLEVVTGTKNFQEVERGITRALRDFGAIVNLTYNSLCVDNLVEMVQFVTDRGARAVKIEFCSTTFVDGHPASGYMVDPQTMVESIVRVYPDLDRITNGRILFDMMVPFCIWPTEFIHMLHANKRLLSVCHVHKRKGLIFDGAGRVIMCNALFDYPIGQFRKDFHDGASLLRWLNKSEVLRYYDRIGSYPSTACKECDWHLECGGGCPLRWATYRPDDVVRPMVKRFT